MTRDVIAVLCCLLSGATLGVVLLAVRSFGSYTERIERASTLARQSEEMTRQFNMRTIEEVRANTAEVKLVRELFEERTNSSRSA